MPRNPPNEIQRILQFTEHAHRDNEEGNETDQSGQGAVNRVSGAVQHWGLGIGPFFPEKLLQLTKQHSYNDRFNNDHCRTGNSERQEGRERK